jgi:hypothetical protein
LHEKQLASKDKSATHHDGLEFPDGRTVLLTFLCEGQVATVLQLPARPMTAPRKMRRDASATWADSTGQRCLGRLMGRPTFSGARETPRIGGGERGFYEWLEAIADPTHEGHAETKEWADERSQKGTGFFGEAKRRARCTAPTPLTPFGRHLLMLMVSFPSHFQVARQTDSGSASVTQPLWSSSGQF